ncbi:glycosyltransferase [Kordiimonas sp.]|uniref:glycosyltransferase family 2 protein n=1 Tax=Kordiimonas sp. TaxID=1970157 RepID=UPI003A92ECCD
MKSKLTIVIVARNAEATIARAVASVRASGEWPILLIDDCSDDETINVANEVGGEFLKVHKTKQAVGIGNARQTALDHLTTDFAIWLDADDEILPHRPAAMLGALKADADLCFDDAILFDPATGDDKHLLPIPAFVKEPCGILRSYERNWIPALTGGFKTAFARSVGYDRSFPCAEDYDFLLRAIAAGAKIRFLDSVGYRYAHSAQTASRYIELTQKFCEIALAKHDFSSLRKRLEGSGLPEGDRIFTLAQVADKLGDIQAWHAAVQDLGTTEGLIPPYDRPGAWLSAYLRATSALRAHEYAAAAQLLTPLVGNDPSADIYNNLGVALWHLDDHAAAKQQWQRAVELMPLYLDATENLKMSLSGTPQRVTEAPLRRAANRSSYVPR